MWNQPSEGDLGPRSIIFSTKGEILVYFTRTFACNSVLNNRTILVNKPEKKVKGLASFFSKEKGKKEQRGGKSKGEERAKWKKKQREGKS